MDGWHVDIWCNCTCESYRLIAKKLFNVQFIFNNPNLVACYNYNATPQKVKNQLITCKYMMCINYHIQNTFKITMQLANN